MAEKRNLIPKTGLALVLLFFGYCAVTVGTSGSVPGSPMEVLGVVGTILLYVTILVTFATIYIAARRAHRAGSWLWLLAVVFIWPVGYLYTLGVNRHG
jgi:uncharacterized membrane protein YhaH (DUF805 family)